MEQFIPKSALVAEIEKLKLCTMDEHMNFYSEAAEWEYHALSNLESFLNTLEAKEVDLDALSVLAEHLIACDAHLVTPKYRDRELDMLEGLVNNKAQKGE